jgi:hypothetical protein
MTIGRTLILAGAALIVIGVLVTYAPFRLGRLPGDIQIRGRNSIFYFPLGTCLLLSVLLTLALWLLRK